MFFLWSSGGQGLHLQIGLLKVLKMDSLSKNTLVHSSLSTFGGCPSSRGTTLIFVIVYYCTSWNFRGGFIFANFASQTLAKISTSIYVYLYYSNDNISKIAKLTTRELPHLAKTAKITVRENNGVYSTVRAEIFAVVLFSRISRVKPSRKFPLQFMSIYSNDNISKIAKLTTRELPHLAKTAKITVRENNGVYSIWMG